MSEADHARGDQGASLPWVPELVVFDVDGTLQDTFRWWPRVIRQALARFGAEADIPVELPDDGAACAVVGLADEGVWGAFLPAAHAHRWRDLREATVPLEVAELRAGRSYLFAGVPALLRHLRRRGVRTALASNCRSRYFAAVCEGQGLGALSDWQFCLDSAGGCTKSDMVRLAIEAAGTARAVVVGDRESDRGAARDAGVPFVWRANAHGAVTDHDAVWRGDPDELLAILGLPPISSAGAE